MSETETPAATTSAHPAAWRDDPVLPGRLRYWDGSQWTSHVSLDGETYEEPYLGVDQVRWQYYVVNVGMFNAAGRMQATLAAAGEQGWQLVSVFDKGSNWMAGMEKGFMLFRRPVPPGVRLSEEDWCSTLSAVGTR